jgi:cbb3-type cytochrome oxidase maturation protein
MQELIALLAGQFLVSVLMGLAALCLFFWAALSGLLTDVEAVKHQVLRSEGIDDDGPR